MKAFEPFTITLLFYLLCCVIQRRIQNFVKYLRWSVLNAPMSLFWKLHNKLIIFSGFMVKIKRWRQGNLHKLRNCKNVWNGWNLRVIIWGESSNFVYLFFSFNGHNIVSQCVYQNLISTAFFRWHWNIKGVQLYWNRASAWVFSRKFAAYFQNTFSYKHVRRTASAAMSTSFLENNPNLYFLIGFYENNFPTFFFLFLTEHKFRSNIIILIL